MRDKLFTYLFLTLILIAFFSAINYISENDPMSGAPPYGEPEENAPGDVLSWIADWERPEGPAKVALQVGHYKNEEFPDELEKLRGNTGSSGGGKSEWEVNMAIAEQVAENLQEQEIQVEILPATVPTSYWADVFLSIHADGSTDSSKRGFKVAAPWRDYTRNADELVDMLEEEYEEATSWEKDENITRNMRGYYAFAWWRYSHAIHPMTTAAIFETGFLTNPSDRAVLINNPEIPAQAISDGIVEYLNQKDLLQ